MAELADIVSSPVTRVLALLWWLFFPAVLAAAEGGRRGCAVAVGGEGVRCGGGGGER